MSKEKSDNTNISTKEFIYTASAGDGQVEKQQAHNCFGKPVYGPNLSIPRNSREIKRTHIYNFVNKPPVIDNNQTATQNREVIKIDTQTAKVINIIYQKYV